MEWFARVLRRMERAKEHFARMLLPGRHSHKKPHTLLGETEEFLRVHTRALFISFIMLLVVISMIFVPRSRATLAVFYPSTCQGAWLGPSHAAGHPSLEELSPASMFTSENSAVLDGSHGDLACGNFSGEIPGGSEPKSFDVRFHWSFDSGSIVHDGVVQDNAPETDASTGDTTPVTPPADTTQPDAPADGTTPVTDPITDPVPVSDPAPVLDSGADTSLPADTSAPVDTSDSTVPPPTEEPAPAPVTDSPVSDAPVSDTTAEAPTADAPSTDTPSTDPAPADAPVASLFSRGLSSLTALVDGALQSGDSTNTISNITSNVLEVRYSLDGTHWVTLGGVDGGNWQSASFRITDPGIGAWSDISKLEIGLFSADKEGSQPAVYVDAMEIDVNYDMEPTQPLPTVKVDDPSIEILTPKKNNFTLDDAPTFAVKDPGLTADELAGLVREKKATILEDEYGVLATPVNISDTAPASTAPEITSDPVPDTAPTGGDGTSGSVLSAPSILDSVASSALGAFAFGGQKADSPEHARRSFLLSFIRMKNDIRTVFQLSSLSHSLFAFVGDTPPPAIEAVVLDSFGKETTIATSVERVVVDGAEQDQVIVEKPDNMFRPGKYTLRVTLHSAEANIVSDQDFTWGVLAINVDRSIYHPDATAYVQMGVISDTGNTICDADMTLVVTDPLGAERTFATDGGGIVRESQCGPNNVISVPDYYAHVPLGHMPGTYLMTLTAITANGTRVVHDSFQADPDVAFDVERTGPTRIYPGAAYPVTMTIDPKADWEGTVVEKIPSVFTPSVLADAAPYDSVTTVGTDTFISWHLSLTVGTTVTIGYSFLAPPISPEFYLLGPLSLYAAGEDPATATPIFQEVRRWQIADDATCASSGSGNWSSITWTCGHTPTTADLVVITAGDTVTMDANSAVLGTITVNGILYTSDGTSRNLSGTFLTIGSTGRLAATTSVGSGGSPATSTITLSGNSSVTAALTLTSGGHFDAGLSTVKFTGSTTNLIPYTTGFTGADAFYDLTILSADSTSTFAMNAIATVADTLTVQQCTCSLSTALTAGQIAIGVGVTATTFNAGTSTITLTGSTGTLVTVGAGSTFNRQSSTVVVSQAANLTLTSGTIVFNILNLTPDLSGGDVIYTLGTGIGCGSAIRSNPSASSGTPTLTLAGAATMGAGCTLQIAGDSNVTTSLGSSDISLGKLDIQTNGKFSAGTAHNITLTGTSSTLLTMNGLSFLAGTSNIIATASIAGSITINSAGFTGANALYDLTINSNSGTTDALGADLTASHLVTSTSGIFNLTNFTLTAGQMVTAASASTNVIMGTGTIIVTSTTGPLITRGSGSGFSANTGTISPTPDADVTVFAGQAIQFGNFVPSPVLTADRAYAIGTVPVLLGNITVNPSGAGTLTVNMGGAISLLSTKTMTIEGCDNTLPCSAYGKIDNSSASAFAISTGFMAVEANGILLEPTATSTITVTGTSGTLWKQSGSVTGTGANVTFNGVAGSAITLVSGSAVSFPNNVTVTNTSTSNAETLGAGMTVRGTLTITSGTVDTSSSGNWPITAGFINLTSATNAKLLANASTITFTGTGTGTLFTKGTSATWTPGTSAVFVTSASGSPRFISTALTFYDVTIATTGAVVVNANAVATITHTFDISSGVFNLEGQTMSTSGTTTFQMESGTTFCLGGTTSSTTADCASGITQTGVSTMPSFTTYSFDPASTVIYLANAGVTLTPQTISVTPAYGNLKFAPKQTTAHFYTFAGAATINGNFTIQPTTGTFLLTVRMGGNITVGSTKTTTITRSDSATSTLITRPVSTDWALSTGTLDIEAGGTLNSSGAASAITIAGSWINNGTFTPGTSTVLFNTGSTATLSGSGTNTFSTLQIIPGAGTGKQVNFTAGNTFTASTFTVTGSGGNLVKLFSTSAGSQWTLVPGVTANNTVAFADVKDSSCSSASSTKFINATNTTNDGNNSLQTAGCWSFATPYLNFTLSSNAVDFGTLSPVSTKYATGGTLSGGSASEVEAHQITVATSGTGGFNLYIQGASLSNGGHTVTPIVCSGAAPSVGTEQFGIRLTVLGGSGTASSGTCSSPNSGNYAGSGFSYAATSSTADIIGSYAGTALTTTAYSVRYVSNMSSATPAGNYSTSLVYVVTGNF